MRDPLVITRRDLPEPTPEEGEKMASIAEGILEAAPPEIRALQGDDEPKGSWDGAEESQGACSSMSTMAMVAFSTALKEIEIQKADVWVLTIPTLGKSPPEPALQALSKVLTYVLGEAYRYARGKKEYWDKLPHLQSREWELHADVRSDFLFLVIHDRRYPSKVQEVAPLPSFTPYKPSVN